MKNLNVLSFPSFDLGLQSEDETLLLSAFDIERNRLFFASSANILYSFELPSSQKRKTWNKSPQIAPVTLDPGDFITAMDCLLEKEALVLGTSDGCLILHTMDDSTTELVGRVEGGVKCIACSPDGALLAITSGIGQLLVMTHDWEVLHESALNLKNDAIGDVDGYPYQFYAPISWRGDGKYFATLGGFHECSLKKLRIWERESGMLHSETDAKSFVGEALDWMPSGAKVTTAYHCEIGTNPLIVFFEKNGLERNSLCIDESGEISIIKWNCSSDLLATFVMCARHDAIKIWFFSNNHWYLKREIRYLKREGVKFMWNPTKPTNLICWTLDGRITTYNFAWMTAITENSTALVVDGTKLLVSPLNLSLMPPPMSLFTLKFQTAIQDVAFLSNSSKNHLAASLSDGSLCIMELPGIDSWEQFEDKEIVIETSMMVDSTLGTLTHLMWLDSHLLLGVSCNQNDLCLTSSRDENELIYQKSNCSKYSLLEIEVVCPEYSVPELANSSGWHSTLSKSLPLEGSVVGIVSNPCKKASAFVQMEGGSIFEYMSGSSLRRGPPLGELNPEYGFSASCPLMKAVSVCDHGTIKTLLFGLDYNGKLQVGNRILCNNCSSFTLYSSSLGGTELITHLILTTKQDLLFIVSIDDILHGNKEMKFEDCNEMKNRRDKDKDYVNVWERGAKLIGALHGDEAAVILQTNRGNLECIYPRKLVLTSILNALVQRRFKDALAMVRRHRIDFNFIIDCFSWQNFVKSAAEFVKQIDNLAHVTEFVSSVKGGNVMDVLYKDYVSPSLPDNETSNVSIESSIFMVEGKVNSVLRAVRKALEEQVQESPARELCILTTLACNEPPSLEKALERIKSIREMEVLGVNDAKRTSYPTAEESLKHLLWLSDPEAVFETALGLYDLNLAAIVALNSQKDPKEFLPYLKELENLPPVIMRYTIDLRLQRYESALKHMFSAGEAHYEECLNLMKNNPQLFSLGLQLFAKNVKRKEVLEAWGDLLNEKCFPDAASAYLCSSSHQKALKAYRGCGDWKGVLTVAALVGLSKADVIQLANELCEEFQALGKPAEAARIALDYCNDVGRCVGYYIMAREWEEALRISHMHEREDLASHVEEAALECASSLISDYNEAREKVGKYLARYLAVRQRRILLSTKIQSEGRLIENTDYDSVSEISSNFSEMSAYTTRTARDSVTSTASTPHQKAREMRRKANKGGKIRAGSPGEEMALIEHLKGMALTDGALRELKSLLSALLLLGMEEIARQLQRSGDNFQLSQYSAVKLAEDTISNDRIDESSQNLEYYIALARGSWHSEEACSWQFRVLTP